jgi:ribosomal protein L1
MDVAGAVKASKGGAVEFRIEKAGITRGTVGEEFRFRTGDAKVSRSRIVFAAAVLVRCL